MACYRLMCGADIIQTDWSKYKLQEAALIKRQRPDPSLYLWSCYFYQLSVLLHMGYFYCKHIGESCNYFRYFLFCKEISHFLLGLTIPHKDMFTCFIKSKHWNNINLISMICFYIQGTSITRFTLFLSVR